jgi:hypothetical protein
MFKDISSDASLAVYVLILGMLFSVVLYAEKPTDRL